MLALFNIASALESVVTELEYDYQIIEGMLDDLDENEDRKAPYLERVYGDAAIADTYEPILYVTVFHLRQQTKSVQDLSKALYEWCKTEKNKEVSA